MRDDDLIAYACETNFAFLALGNERFEACGASFVRNRDTPRRHDANCVGLIRTNSPAELDALLQRAEIEFDGFAHRSWAVDAFTPPQALARLALEEGYRSNDGIVHVLEGDLRMTTRRSAPSLEVEIREVLTEDDWAAYRELDAMWWQETSTGYLGPYDPAVHDEHMLNRRLKSPVRAWFACVDGVPRAFFNSWPGDNGVGIVEDLFCHPEYRRRGLATTLLVLAVDDCRERGAGPVIINSDPEETPKHMYTAMRFRPLFVRRVYVKRLTEQKDASA